MTLASYAGGRERRGRERWEETVRVAVVGLGYWGPNLVRSLQDVAGVEVTHVCDLDEGALRKLVRRYGHITATTDFSSILADPRVEAVVICTPVSTHYALASQALAAGKHVFVEKPLAGSSAEGRALVSLARRERLVLMPGHTFLYSPPVNLIRDLIAAGDVGDIYFISMSRVNLGLHQADASVIWDLGPHDFSILQYWLGESPSHVSALARACIFPNTPDVAFINAEFSSGAVAHIELSWLAPSKLRRTAIVGSKKMIVYDDTSNEPVRVFDSGVTPPAPENFGEFQLSYRAGDIVSPRPRSTTEPLRLEMADFCHAIRTGGVPRSSAAVGLAIVDTLEAVDRSLAAAGSRVPVDDGVDEALSA